MKLLLASYNQGKLHELQALLTDVPVDLISPASLNLSLDVVEDGLTYQENAARKALAFAQASGYLSLADDSGLEVDVLDGQPGLHSARFSPIPGATDRDRRTLLLKKVHNKPRPWVARFRCVIALAAPAGKLYFSEGVCPGEIIPKERGQNGFGYDPIFLLPDLGKTMAELSMEEKNRLSHRARAVLAAKGVLRQLVSDSNDSFSA
jgi:XTP/dITP diphosphohydrolase